MFLQVGDGHGHSKRGRLNSFVGEAREKNLELNANEVSVEPEGQQVSRAAETDAAVNPFSLYAKSHILSHARSAKRQIMSLRQASEHRARRARPQPCASKEYCAQTNPFDAYGVRSTQLHS